MCMGFGEGGSDTTNDRSAIMNGEKNWCWNFHVGNFNIVTCHQTSNGLDNNFYCVFEAQAYQWLLIEAWAGYKTYMSQRCITPAPHSYSLMWYYLSGLQVAQVHVIFRMPDHLRGCELPKYHTDIEWFNPLCAPDPNSLLHSVTHSYQHGHPLTEIIQLTDIVIWLLNLEPISTLLLGQMLKYLITGNPSPWTSIFT